MLTSMRTYGSSLTLRSSEDEALQEAKQHLALPSTELQTGGAPVDLALIQSATSLDQLFAAFSQVLRRTPGGEIIGSSGADAEWVNPKPLMDALHGAFEEGSWYAYCNDFFDYVLLFEQNQVKEHFYDLGVVDPDEAPYREYPHGVGAPDPGRGHRYEQLTRVIRHWLFTKNVKSCQVTSLTPEEAVSFIADALR